MIALTVGFIAAAVYLCDVTLSVKMIEVNSIKTILLSDLHLEALHLGSSRRYLEATLNSLIPLSEISSIVLIVNPVYIYGWNYSSQRKCWLPGNDIYAEFILPNGSSIWIRYLSYRVSPTYVKCNCIAFDPLNEGYFSFSSNKWLYEPLKPFKPKFTPQDPTEYLQVLHSINLSITISANELYGELSKVFTYYENKSPPSMSKVLLKKLICRECNQMYLYVKKSIAKYFALMEAKIIGLNMLSFHVTAINVENSSFKGSIAIFQLPYKISKPLKVTVILESRIFPVKVIREFQVSPSENSYT